MTPPLNLDDRIGKTVGRRRPPQDPLQASRYTPADALAWKKVFQTPFVPRGVYRFSTHQEADAWLMKILTRVKSNPANRPSRTSEPSVAS